MEEESSTQDFINNFEFYENEAKCRQCGKIFILDEEISDSQDMCDHFLQHNSSVSLQMNEETIETDEDALNINNETNDQPNNDKSKNKKINHKERLQNNIDNWHVYIFLCDAHTPV